ncbi:hypothetical protein C7S13_8068 [Burkholderia cepacia]|nr:hypothetical protein [Burkholderia cepacia]MDW9245877.1 hypothetical protein [Burkholderia cepacia]
MTVTGQRHGDAGRVMQLKGHVPAPGSIFGLTSAGHRRRQTAVRSGRM